MAINKKLIYFKHKSNFTTALNDKQILDTSIVWIEDTKEIYTHGQYFGFPADRDSDLTTVETLANQLSQELNTEKAVRAEADSDLNSKITAEVTARQTADQNIQTSIDTLEATTNTLQSSVTTLLTSYNNLQIEVTENKPYLIHLGDVSKAIEDGQDEVIITDYNIPIGDFVELLHENPTATLAKLSLTADMGEGSTVKLYELQYGVSNNSILGSTGTLHFIVELQQTENTVWKALILCQEGVSTDLLDTKLTNEINSRTSADTALDNKITELQPYNFGTITLTNPPINNPIMSGASSADLLKLTNIASTLINSNKEVKGFIKLSISDLNITNALIPITISYKKDDSRGIMQGALYKLDGNTIEQDIIEFSFTKNTSSSGGYMAILSYFKRLRFYAPDTTNVFNPTTS